MHDGGYRRASPAEAIRPDFDVMAHGTVEEAASRTLCGFPVKHGYRRGPFTDVTKEIPACFEICCRLRRNTWQFSMHRRLVRQKIYAEASAAMLTSLVICSSSRTRSA